MGVAEFEMIVRLIGKQVDVGSEHFDWIFESCTKNEGWVSIIPQIDQC